MVSYLVQAFKEMLRSFKEQRELLQWFQVFESYITLGTLMNSNYFTKRQVSKLVQTHSRNLHGEKISDRRCHL